MSRYVKFEIEGRHAPSNESLTSRYNSHESNNLATTKSDSMDQGFLEDNNPVDFDSASIRELEAEFGKLCRSPVVRNRTRALINQYQRHFGNQIEIDDIFSEVYIRALRVIKSGKTIQNLPAWTRTTSVNIVRELYRAADREHKLEKSAKQELFSECSEPSESCDPEDPIVIKLWARFKDLSPAEQNILLWEAGGKPYRLISELLIAEGFETSLLSENAIAQRVRRARKKLRSGIPEQNL